MKNERKAKISMGFWFSFIVLVENLFAIGTSTVAVTVLNNAFGRWINIEPAILVLLFSVFIGIILTFSMNRLVLIPLKRLNVNMNKVAKGDFSARINEKTVIKEVNNMYNNFNLMVEELGALEIIQSDFISNVSHEFKTPINAIEGYSMLLQGCENVNAEQKMYIDKILFNTNRISNLVGNVLLLAKLDNQSIQNKFAKFRLDEQIRQSILAQEIQWSEKNIELDVDLEEIDYYGTEELLVHVWSNLLNNAIKFSPKDEKISMRLCQNNGFITFTISDNGKGVDERIKNKIFDKFYQGDGAHKEKGNGLGLALAKQIIDINGGEITVENKQTGGCVFTVKLKNK